MKIVLERDVLAEAVAWTARALPSRPTVPVLAGIQMRAGTELTFSSFDYDTAWRLGLSLRELATSRNANSRSVVRFSSVKKLANAAGTFSTG